MQESEREVAQSCPTLSDPMDYSLPGSSVHGIFQARVLEWGASSLLSHIQLLATPWTAPYQASLSMGFSRQEYWSGVPYETAKETLMYRTVFWTLWEREIICGMIWENGIETFIISYMKRVASPGSMHDTGCLGLVH